MTQYPVTFVQKTVHSLPAVIVALACLLLGGLVLAIVPMSDLAWGEGEIKFYQQQVCVGLGIVALAAAMLILTLIYSNLRWPLWGALLLIAAGGWAFVHAALTLDVLVRGG